ncbi:MAG: hypothetical protein ACJAVV_000355 [Alphaproteobacteria bacterium]|jgi:uncharacterized protein with NRDE domain
MCILFIAVKQHPLYPLIIAANRDEFHLRPTQTSHFWPKQDDILAGKDLLAGGTWMGINKKGDLAALTNIRAPGKERENALSRGELVTNFLLPSTNKGDYLNNLKNSHFDYNGYNLLFGNITQLQVYNSFDNTSFELEEGVYGLSNASLDSPWPKLDVGKSALAHYCQHAGKVSFEHLFELLGNSSPANDEDLPDTGIPIEWEKMLSSIFIQSPDYGTRSSTVLLIDNDQQVYWEERTFSVAGECTDTTVHKFAIQP